MSKIFKHSVSRPVIGQWTEMSFPEQFKYINGGCTVLETLELIKLINSLEKWSLFSSVSRTCESGVSNYLVVLVLYKYKY